LKRAGQEALPFALVFSTGSIEALHDGAFGADDGRVEAGHAEAALFFELHAFAREEFGIDHHDQGVRVAAERDVDDENAHRYADLRGGQPNTWRGVHRVDHVGNNGGDIGGDRVNRPGRLVEDLVAVLQDWANHRYLLTAEHADAAEARTPAEHAEIAET